MASESEKAGLDGTVRAPSFDAVCGWIASAWKLVSKEIILTSFNSCGLTTSLDGSEDGNLHCFKLPDLSDGLRRLSEARAAQSLSNLDVPDLQQQPEDDNDSEPQDDDILVDNMFDLALGAEQEF